MCEAVREIVGDWILMISVLLTVKAEDRAN